MQKLSISIGGLGRLQIEGETPQELIRQAAFWHSLPDSCPVCSSPVVFDYATPKNYKYYKLKCTGKTPHSVNLSEKQDGSGMYYDRSKPWEVWRAGATEGEQAEHSAAAALPGHANDPNSPRGQAIARIGGLMAEAAAAGVRVAVDTSNLGGKSDTQLAAIEKHINGLLAPASVRRGV